MGGKCVKHCPPEYAKHIRSCPLHLSFGQWQMIMTLSMSLQGHIAEKKQAKRRRSGHRSSSGKLAFLEVLLILIQPLSVLSCIHIYTVGMVYHIIDFGLVSLSSMQQTSGWTYAASSAHSRSSGQSCMHRHLASTRKETQLLISLHDRQYQLGNAQTSGAQQVVHVSQQQCM